MEINKILAEEFKLRQEQVVNTVALIDDGRQFRLSPDTVKS